MWWGGRVKLSPGRSFCWCSVTTENFFKCFGDITSMFCLQNDETIFIPSLPGYPIWRPETWICDWKLGQNRISLILLLLCQTISNTDRISYIGNWRTLLLTYFDIGEWFFMSQIQYGGHQTGSTYISGSILDSSEIMATPMFPWIIGAMACT